MNRLHSRRNPRFCAMFQLATIFLWMGAVAGAQDPDILPPSAESDSTLVRVNIITETLGDSESVIINGKRLTNYRPRIIRMFPSTGIVLDDAGNILTFLGYRWIEIQSREPRVEIITAQGKSLKGKMVGIDQSVGVAVVHSRTGGLMKTPLCEHCEIQHGATVITPAGENDHQKTAFALQSAQIVSIDGNYPPTSQAQNWVLTINRPVPGIGEPLLDAEHRVLGFIADKQPAWGNPDGVATVIYPISQLLTSAEKILKAGGDIRTGWLGVFLDDTGTAPGSKVIVKSVEEQSPAQKSGLAPKDILTRWNGKEIIDTRQFIHLVQQSPIGSKVNFDVLREGKTLRLSAVIEARKPRPEAGRFVLNFPDMISFADTGFFENDREQAAVKKWLGIDMIALSPQLADSFQLAQQSGLLVVNVDEQTPFARAGVQVGDVILAVNGQQFVDPQLLASELHSGALGNRLRLKLVRKGVERIATILLFKPAAQTPQNK